MFLKIKVDSRARLVDFSNLSIDRIRRYLKVLYLPLSLFLFAFVQRYFSEDANYVNLIYNF